MAAKQKNDTRCSQSSGLVRWSSNAQDGAWQKTGFKVFDLNGAEVNLSRNDIGTGEDLTHSSGNTNLNTL
jgi:hypothetical protein